MSGVEERLERLALHDEFFDRVGRNAFVVKGRKFDERSFELDERFDHSICESRPVTANKDLLKHRAVLCQAFKCGVCEAVVGNVDGTKLLDILEERVVPCICHYTERRYANSFEILKAVADVAELGVGKKARVVKLQVLHAWLDVIVDLGIHKLFSFAHFNQFVHPLCFHLDKRVWHRVQVRAELRKIGKGVEECRKTGVRMTSSEFRVCLNTSTFKL